MTNSTDAPQGNWWTQRALWQKIALVVGGIFIAFIVLGMIVGDPEDSGTAADTTVTTASGETTTTAEETTTTAAETTTTSEATTTSQATTTTETPTTTTTLPDIEEVQQDVIDLFIELMEGSEYERVDVIYFDNEGSLIIEATQQWASESRQENTHWETVKAYAGMFGEVDASALKVVFGGEPIVHLTTVSTDGDYRYQSWTDHPSFTAINDRKMGLDAWKDASDAGFQ